MNKYLTIAFHVNLVFIVVGFTFQNIIAIYIGVLLVTPILFLLYGNTQKWQFNKIDTTLIFALLLGFLSDCGYSIAGNISIIWQFSFALLSNILLYYIFRLKSFYVIYTKSSDFWKFFIPLIPLLFFVGTILFTKIKDENIYFLAGIYSIFSYYFLVSMFYLSINPTSKLLAIIGVTFRVINDVLYTIALFFPLDNTSTTITIFLFSFYAYGQYFIVLSILTSNNKLGEDYVENKAIIPNLILKVLNKFEQSNLFRKMF